MIRAIVAAASLALIATGVRAQEGAAPPPVTIAGTELRTIHSAITGRDYDLYVYPPPRPEPGRRYPVLYLLDAQWDFKLLTAIEGGLLYDRYVPDVIIVGITYHGANANYDSLRAIDYTPNASPANPGSGGGARFLGFIERELIPFVESRYPIDPSRRGLMGASLGGLFTLYAMWARPGLFSRYAAGSPAVSYADRAVFADEAAYAASHTDLPARLYIAVGSEEPFYGPVQEMVEKLRSRRYPGLQLESRVIQGERHSGNKPEGFNRGLRFLFGDLQPQTAANR